MEEPNRLSERYPPRNVRRRLRRFGATLALWAHHPNGPCVFARRAPRTHGYTDMCWFCVRKGVGVRGPTLPFYFCDHQFGYVYDYEHRAVVEGPCPDQQLCYQFEIYAIEHRAVVEGPRPDQQLCYQFARHPRVHSETNDTTASIGLSRKGRVPTNSYATDSSAPVSAFGDEEQDREHRAVVKGPCPDHQLCYQFEM